MWNRPQEQCRKKNGGRSWTGCVTQLKSSLCIARRYFCKPSNTENPCTGNSTNALVTHLPHLPLEFSKLFIASYPLTGSTFVFKLPSIQGRQIKENSGWNTTFSSPYQSFIPWWVGLEENSPDFRSCTTSSPVWKASFIVVAMTPTGPFLTQPLQYRPNVTKQSQTGKRCGVIHSKKTLPESFPIVIAIRATHSHPYPSLRVCGFLHCLSVCSLYQTFSQTFYSI